MKKARIFALLLAVVMLFALTACGDKESDKKDFVKVSFDTDGGSSVNSMEIKTGSTVTKPENPTKSGFVFEKWTLNGKDYDFSAAVNEDITLKAVWKDDGSAAEEARKKAEEEAKKKAEEEAKKKEEEEKKKAEGELLSDVKMSFKYKKPWVLVNNDIDLEFKIEPAEAMQYVTFTSSDENIATVNSQGVVWAVGPGVATITAKAGDKEISVPVEVVERNTGIEVPNDVISINYWGLEKDVDLQAKALPEHAMNKELTYKSDNTKVAVVDKNGIVSGREIGEAHITISDGAGHEKKVTVYVNGAKLVFNLWGDEFRRNEYHGYDVFIQDYQNGKFTLTDMYESVEIKGTGDYLNYLQLFYTGSGYTIGCVKAPETGTKTFTIWLEVYKGKYAGLQSNEEVVYILPDAVG